MKVVGIIIISIFIVGCSATKPIGLRQGTTLCLQEIKSDELSKEEVIESLHRVVSSNTKFNGYNCDSSDNKLLIRIIKTNINGKNKSYFSLAANIYFPLVGLYLGYTTENPLWFLLGAIQLSPRSFIEYSIEYHDGADKRGMATSGPYWFKDKKRTKREVLLDFAKQIELLLEE